MCGYCDICTGYFEVDYKSLDTGAENQLCPTGAIYRRFVGEKAGQRFYEYTIDESRCKGCVPKKGEKLPDSKAVYAVDQPLCIGCGKCVKGCALMNGSLYLQVMHDRCLNCNECSIAIACPSQAFRRVPASQPHLLKKLAAEALANRAEREKAAREEAEKERSEGEQA
jgi:electron transport complex protein RnfB